jgi:hypothetical protein
VLDRYGGDTVEDSTLANELYVFSRFTDDAAFVEFAKSTKETWEEIALLTSASKRTTWVTAGIGFLGR